MGRGTARALSLAGGRPPHSKKAMKRFPVTEALCSRANEADPGRRVVAPLSRGQIEYIRLRQLCQELSIEPTAG